MDLTFLQTRHTGRVEDRVLARSFLTKIQRSRFHRHGTVRRFFLSPKTFLKYKRNSTNLSRLC